MATPRLELTNFLVRAYTVAELRRLLAYMVYGPRLLPHMQFGGGIRDVAVDLVELMQRHGVTREIFPALLETRPERRAEIESIARRYGVALNPPEEAPAFARPTIVILFTDQGFRRARALRAALASLPQGGREIRLVKASDWTPALVTPPTVACVVIGTDDLIVSPSPHDTLLRDLRDANARRAVRVYVVVATESPWRSTSLGRVAALPLNGVPMREGEDEWRWGEIATLITQQFEISASAAPPSAMVSEADADVSKTDREEKQVLAVSRLPIAQIFKTTGSPVHTFVAPRQYNEILTRLRIPGQGLVIDGPSGVGKTTAVRHALQVILGAELDQLQEDGKVIWIDGGNEDDQKRLAKLAPAARKLKCMVVVDDYHRLPDKLRKAVPTLMKSVADADNGVAKVVVIGINPVGRSLIHDMTDVTGRFHTIPVGRQEDALIRQLIEKGARAARVSFDHLAAYVVQARGSLLIAQMLCQEACFAEEVMESLDVPMVLTLDPQLVVRAIQSQLKERFGDLVLDFACYTQAPPPGGATFAWLWMLAQSREGTVSATEIKARFPQVAAHLAWLTSSNLSALLRRNERLGSLLHYNRDAELLSTEDLRLEFYLNNLDWRQFARASGHPNLTWGEDGSPQFDQRSHVASPLSAEHAAPRQAARLVLPPATVLHLSDLHFQNIDQSSQAFEQLYSDLYVERHHRTLAAVVVSGDIGNRAQAQEYTAAEEFLRDLRRVFKVSPSQVVLVPGNHDVNYDLSKKSYRPTRRSELPSDVSPDTWFGEAGYVELRDEDPWRARFTPFARFYQAVRQETYPLDPASQATIHHIREASLVILGLNSAWQVDHHFEDRADIHGLAIGRALRAIAEEPAYTDCLKIAVWHHPVHSGEDSRIRDTGFLELLAQNGFRLGLHGHIHKAQNGLYRYDVSQGGRRLELLGAGTFGAATRELSAAYPWQYQILEFEGSKLQVHTRRREEPNGAWKPDARWTPAEGEDPLPHYTIEL